MLLKNIEGENSNLLAYLSFSAFGAFGAFRAFLCVRNFS